MNGTIDIKIEQLTTFTPHSAQSIRQLVEKIGNNYKPLTDEDITEMISSPNIFLFLAYSEKAIVGMITLIVYRIPYVKKAYIDDLVVDETYRGKGIGSKLMQKAVSSAKEKGAGYIDFTARPERVESNSLYGKLGFKKRDTNVYRLLINYGQV